MTRLASALLVVVLITVSGCASDDDRPQRPAPETEAETALSSFQLEHGIGPFVQEVQLSDQIDRGMAEAGLDIYQRYCEACHDMNTRLVGPPLGDVVERRSPTFILNMMMNPEQMVREHPEGQAMLQQYPVVMPYQNISEEQAMQILEYFRLYASGERL